MPGLPFVIIGHNKRVAWGFTNSFADCQDLVIEEFDAPAGRALPHRTRLRADPEAARDHPREGRVRRARGGGGHPPRPGRRAHRGSRAIDLARARAAVDGAAARRRRRRAAPPPARHGLEELPRGLRPLRRPIPERGLCRRRRAHRLSALGADPGAQAQAERAAGAGLDRRRGLDALPHARGDAEHARPVRAADHHRQQPDRRRGLPALHRRRLHVRVPRAAHR